MSKRALKLFGLGTALVLALAAAGLISGAESLAAQSCTVSLSPNDSIQQAIDTASSGAVICLGEGTWEENLVIVGKSLTLRGAGAGKTVIRSAERSRPVVWIESDEIEVNLEGVTITGASGFFCLTPPERCAIGLVAKGSAQVSLTNSQVSGNELVGLWVEDSAQVSLQDSTVSGNEMYGLSVGGSAQVNLRDSTVSGNVDEGLGSVCAGLSVGGSAQVTLRSSTVYGNNDGLLVGGSAQVILQDSKVYRNGHGFNVGGSTRVSLQGSTISENRGRGLDVRASAQVSLTNSRVAGNGELGLFVGGSAQVSLWNSEVSLNMAFGLSVNDSARVSLKSSTVSGNWKGGLVVHDSAQVSIEGSLIEENGSVLRCKAYWSCNGIAVEGKAHVELTSTTIRKNPGWGIAASHFNFEGKVLWEGRGNEIYDNGKGDVCLP